MIDRQIFIYTDLFSTSACLFFYSPSFNYTITTFDNTAPITVRPQVCCICIIYDYHQIERLLSIVSFIIIICLAHNHHIAGQQLMLINQPSFKIYRYIIVGEQGVGKTNLITRFTKDQFVDNHNLMLQGQQTAIFHLNRCKYKLIFEDQHNVTSLSKLPLQFFQTINGIIFVFSFDNQKTFEAIEKELAYLQESILPTLNTKRTQISTILVGNKTDKLAPFVQIEDCMGQLKISNRTCLQQRARLLSSQANMKYFEISSKCSPKKQIQKLYMEMINQNDINTFRATEKEKRMWQRALSLHLPCSSTQQSCIIY